MNALGACRAAHRAWLATQPHYVIPGVLEEVDADAMLTATAAASASSSPPRIQSRSPLRSPVVVSIGVGSRHHPARWRKPMVAASFWNLVYWSTFLAVVLYFAVLLATYLTWREHERDRRRRTERLRRRRYDAIVDDLKARRWDGTEIRP